MNRILAFLLCLLVFSCKAPRTAISPAALKSGFFENLSPSLAKRLTSGDNIQIIYTSSSGKTEQYKAQDSAYFYPASTVKLPVALLALEKAARLNLDINSIMVTDSACCRQQKQSNDPMSATGQPSIAQYIREIFLISDNDAFNRLYEFCGQSWINQRLQELGFTSARIVHRLNIPFSQEENRNTNPVHFYDTTGKLLFSIPSVRSDYQPIFTPVFLGKGYMMGSKTIKQPFDFTYKNQLSLADLHDMIQRVITPEKYPVARQFRIRAADLAWLKQCIYETPSQVSAPDLKATHPDGYLKFLLQGGEGALPQGLRIYNKSGDAYGFLTDVTCFEDSVHNIRFFLSATISCNSDGIYNDDKYDYATVGLPFMKELGTAIYQYELAQQKKRE